MTVKVSKPPLNLREELSALNKPTGIAGEAMLRAKTVAEQQALMNHNGRHTGTTTMDGLVVGNGGIQVGGTGEANKLDDYEEGTWTPALSTGTHSYSVQHGKYTKIGNQVTVWARMIVTSRGSNGSELGISGLPFSSSGSPLASTFGMLNTYGTAGLLPQAVAPTGGSMEGNIAYLRNQYATNSSYTVNHLNSSGGLTIAFTYMTA